MSEPESKFPTIADVLAWAQECIELGYGELPVQIIVAPDSTLQAIARGAGARDDSKPALMIEWEGREGRVPVMVISSERLDNKSERTAVQ